MEIISKFLMFAVVVDDMPKAKEFYSEKLGFKVMSDYRQSDERWWVALTVPEGITITLTTFRDKTKPGPMTMWFATSDINASHKALADKGVKVSDIGDDLHGPGSGTKWFNFTDSEGNLIHIEQA